MKPKYENLAHDPEVVEHYENAPKTLILGLYIFEAPDGKLGVAAETNGIEDPHILELVLEYLDIIKIQLSKHSGAIN